jgi:hypothetical protein
MKRWKTSRALVAALALCATAAYAQDQKQDVSPIDPNAPLQPLETSPGPAYPNRPPIGAARGVAAPFDPQQYDPSQVSPDENTLAGAAPFTLGSLQHTGNIFDPVISVSQLGQTVPIASGKTILTGISVASGSLNFNRTWSEYQFTTVYNGGETFNLGYGAAPGFFGATSPHFQFHNLSVTQEAAWARWHVLLRDNFVASPGAQFSGQGIGGPGLVAQFSSMLGSSLNNLGQSFQPVETINTAEAMRYQNSILGQAEYSLSRRSALTFSGSYGVLDFTGAGYFSSTKYNAQAGYDYQLDPSDSFAILASYGKIDYNGTGTGATGTLLTGNGNSTTDYLGALAFGRKITGRLAFQVAAGPQEIYSTGPGAAGKLHLLFASVNSALTYERRRSGVSFTFVRGLSTGSGVILGATSNAFSGSAHYQLTRHWSAIVNGGYALNNSLPTAGAATIRFDNWFAGANLGRQIGTHAQINFNYGALEQNNPPNCPQAICGGVGLQQIVGMSVNWHLRSIGETSR